MGSVSRLTRCGVARCKAVARLAQVSRFVVQAFVNQGTVPQAATIAKLEAVL